MRRLLAALLVAAAPSLAQAQFAVIAPDTPLGDSTNRIVNTRSMLATLASGLPLAAGTIYIGNSSNLATSRTVSGDCTISMTGVVTCTGASGNFNVGGNLSVTGSTALNGTLFVTGASTYTGLATFNGGTVTNGSATVNGTLTVNGGLTINGVRQPRFAWALPLSAGGIVYQDWAGLNVLQSPFPNKMLMSGFKGQPPKWTATTWADAYANGTLLYSNGPNNVQPLTVGTGVLAALGVNVGSSGAFVVNGGALGTPSSATLTNATGLPTTGLTGTLQAAQFPALTNDVTTSAGSLSTTIANNAVTNAKLADMANATIKCRTTAGTGDPEDCTAAQTAALIGVPGGALKVGFISGSRDLTVATGSVAYTGLGFQPKACYGNGSVAASTTQYVVLFAMTDGSNQFQSNISGSTFGTVGGVLMTFQDAGGANLQNGTLSSFDADGFTISWVKTGVPTGTASFRFICMR